MFIDFHILQSVPPNNINRDDTGSPKTAVYGGTRRARVSSQAWKRATREYFRTKLDKSDLGTRTRVLAEMLGNRIAERIDGIEADEAFALASSVFHTAGIKMTKPKVKKDEKEKPDESGYLLFLSEAQINSLTDLAVAAHADDGALDKKRIKEIINSDHSIDVALFGRMVADDAELNVDASVQVAHALSVQAVEQEFDYFTAVDDFTQTKNETGAGMIGTIEFNSSTLYRYATLNVAGLRVTLGDPAATARAAAVFTEAFVRSMPTGKQNTFANRTLPEAVIISVRDDQPVNLAGAFEDAVVPTVDEGAVPQAVKKLIKHDSDIAGAYDPPQQRFHTSIGAATPLLTDFGEALSFNELVSRIEEVVTTKLSAPA